MDILLVCFNSTLVQLKDSFNIHIQGSQERFNSTLVQLKALARYSAAMALNVSILP